MATKINLRQGLAYAAGAIVIALVLGLVVLQWRYGALLAQTEGPPPTGLRDAGIYIAIDPGRIRPLVAVAVDEITGLRVPAWILDRALPYQAGLAVILDFDERRLDLRGFLNPKRLAPEIRRRFSAADWRKRFPQVYWPENPVQRTDTGLLTLSATLPMEPDAEEAFWYTWNQSIDLSPLPLEGGHFIEVVIDNRQGKAYLAVASLLQAFDIDLDAQEQDISLSSLQFVQQGRMTVDYVAPDALDVRLELEIAPDAVERLGVINLKIAIQDQFAERASRWQQDDLHFSGEGRWEDNKMIFLYRLRSAKRAARLLANGDWP